MFRYISLLKIHKLVHVILSNQSTEHYEIWYKHCATGQTPQIWRAYLDNKNNMAEGYKCFPKNPKSIQLSSGS